jgi:hypothetical protein
MAILKYTTVVMSVTAIGVNERGLVQFMRAIFGRTNDEMELCGPAKGLGDGMGKANQSITTRSCSCTNYHKRQNCWEEGMQVEE